MGKCPFVENCKLANKDHATCMKDDGDYYGPGRMGGCGRDFVENGNKSDNYKKRDKPLSFFEKTKKAFGFYVFE